MKNINKGGLHTLLVPEEVWLHLFKQEPPYIVIYLPIWRNIKNFESLKN